MKFLIALSITTVLGSVKCLESQAKAQDPRDSLNKILTAFASAGYQIGVQNQQAIQFNVNPASANDRPTSRPTLRNPTKPSIASNSQQQQPEPQTPAQLQALSPDSEASGVIRSQIEIAGSNSMGARIRHRPCFFNMISCFTKNSLNANSKGLTTASG